MTCIHALCPYWQRGWPPGDTTIVRVINCEPSDNRCGVDRHVVWEVEFDGVPDDSEDLVCANRMMFLFCFIHAVCTLIAV